MIMREYNSVNPPLTFIKCCVNNYTQDREKHFGCCASFCTPNARSTILEQITYNNWTVSKLVLNYCILLLVCCPNKIVN